MSSDTGTPGEVAIRVRDLEKHYLIFDRPEDRLKQMVVPRLQRLVGRPPRRFYRDFAALNGVSFEIRRGETVGIVGRNGSGKSTLLQLICGTLRPSVGSVEVNGRIAALLELGAGFNPEFTGRENVYLNAAILGLSGAEINERFDSIAAFADVGQFMDQPVKSYSSGMYVRLAFATAINVDPDILVVDEALAVGDEAFQRKCFARIEQIKERGGTILFVSHAAQSVVQLCSRAILIDGGELLADGVPKIVTSQYQKLVSARGENAARIRDSIKRAYRPDAGSLDDVEEDLPPTDSTELQTPSLEAFDPTFTSQSRVEYEPNGGRIVSVRVLNTFNKPVNTLITGETYTCEYEVAYDQPAGEVAFGLMIKTISGVEISGMSTNLGTKAHKDVQAGDTVKVRMTFDCQLAPGVYFINAGAGKTEDGERVMVHRVLDAFIFRVIARGPLKFSGPVNLNIHATFDVASQAANEFAG